MLMLFAICHLPFTFIKHFYKTKQSYKTLYVLGRVNLLFFRIKWIRNGFLSLLQNTSEIMKIEMLFGLSNECTNKEPTERTTMNTRSMTKRFNQQQQQQRVLPFAAMHFVDEAERKAQRNAEAALKKEAEKADKKALDSERKAQKKTEAALKKVVEKAKAAYQMQMESMLKAKFIALKKAVREANKNAIDSERKAQRQWESNLKKAAREADKKALDFERISQAEAEIDAMIEAARTLVSMSQIDM